MRADLFPDEGEFSPRPAWQVIEAARRQLLTGELTLATTPATHVYLRDGQVYFAERSTDGGLGVRLLVEGVITRQQMGKGALLVSGVEHLGRMFQRDTTIDRQSVELCVELMTDDVLTSVANDVIGHYVMNMYKRHTSGIDRWLPTRVEVITHVVDDARLAEPESTITPGPGPRRRVDAVIPAVVQPAPEPVVVEVAVVETPAIEPPAIEPPVVERPVVETPAVEPSVIEVPVVEVPVVIEPVVIEPVAATPPPVVSIGSWEPITAEQLLTTTRMPVISEFTLEPIAEPVIEAADPVAEPVEEVASNDSGIHLAQSAVDAIMSTAIADEVAEAVRRALAAIDGAAQPVPSISPSDFDQPADVVSNA
ncbi:MAG: hypothetical protein Q8M22_15795 [Actinomycetota bacterium]|nr:hypothetical protein [Actinomycetota bacterium]